MLYSDTKMGNISKFTLGTVQLGMNYGMANMTGQPSKEQAFGILDQAALSGVTSLDTAVAYGSSEQVIGEYLQKCANRYFITSKFKLGNEDPVQKLEEQKRLTMEHLGKVDLYFFHNGEELVRYAKQLQEPLLELRERGVTRFLGASVYEAKEIETFLKYDWLQGIQIPMNILDDRLRRCGLLEELYKRGTVVFVRSVFLQGLLCMEQIPERYDFLASYVRELKDIAKSEEMTLMEMSVAYIRDLQGVSSLVLGCETAGQVTQNAELMNAKRISAAGTEAIRALAARVPIEEAMLRIQGKK